MSLLSVENVTKDYPTRHGPLSVLCGISLTVSPGENLAILGPSGSGKSTLLAILGALERPTTGRVLLDDVDPATLDDAALAAFRNRQVGFVFQDHHLLPQCTALENVLIPTLATGTASHDDLRRADELLQRVGLADRRDHRPAELSGGERQRVAIARALVRRPPLVLADEPTGNLDRTTADHIAELLLELQQHEQRMLVVVTHSQRLASRMHRRMELDEGRLKEIGTGSQESQM